MKAKMSSPATLKPDVAYREREASNKASVGISFERRLVANSRHGLNSYRDSSGAEVVAECGLHWTPKRTPNE
jgi:hypothetical protein